MSEPEDKIESTLGKVLREISDIKTRLDKLDESFSELKKQKQENPISESEEFDGVFDEARDFYSKMTSQSDPTYIAKAFTMSPILSKKVLKILARHFTVAKNEFYNGIDLGKGYIVSLGVPPGAVCCVETLVIKDDKPFYIEECGYADVKRFTKFEDLKEDIKMLQEWVSKQD